MWTGECNCCGRCCQLTRTENWIPVVFQCTALLTADLPGRPGATACGMYDKRYVGMPIVMRSVDGRYTYPSKCLSVYPREQDAVPPECSFKWSGKDKPAWSLLYAPKY